MHCGIIAVVAVVAVISQLASACLGSWERHTTDSSRCSVACGSTSGSTSGSLGGSIGGSVDGGTGGYVTSVAMKCANAAAGASAELVNHCGAGTTCAVAGRFTRTLNASSDIVRVFATPGGDYFAVSLSFGANGKFVCSGDSTSAESREQYALNTVVEFSLVVDAASGRVDAIVGSGFSCTGNVADFLGGMFVAIGTHQTVDGGRHVSIFSGLTLF